MSDRSNSMFYYLFRGRYDRFKPNRSHELKRRFKMSDQTQAVQQLISQGYFNDPCSAQRFLDKHHATRVSEVRDKLPRLYRKRTFWQRLRRFLLFLTGEYETEGRTIAYEKTHAKKARNRHGHRRIPYRVEYIRQRATLSRPQSRR
jgi:hypothetical protein